MASTYIIADVHGHLAALESILAAAKPGSADLVITLGDYIDRGPNSKGVLDLLMKLQSQTRVISLLGNHEEMLLNARQQFLLAAEGKPGNPRIVAEWLMNGGDKALESYDLEAMRAGNVQAAFRSIPQAHWDFLATCKNYYENETHLFVHAGVNPYLPLDQQEEHTLRWERFDDPPQHVSGKVLVCGHTPQRSGLPRFIGHAVCLDTGIHVGRFLSCLQLPEGQVLQASPNGALRKSALTDFLVTPHPRG